MSLTLPAPSRTAPVTPDRCSADGGNHGEALDMQCILDAGTHEEHLDGVGSTWADGTAHVMDETTSKESR